MLQHFVPVDYYKIYWNSFNANVFVMPNKIVLENLEVARERESEKKNPTNKNRKENRETSKHRNKPSERVQFTFESMDRDG